MWKLQTEDYYISNYSVSFTKYILTKFNVHGYVNCKNIPIYIQQDATLHSLFISENWSTCFGWYHHPSSGALTAVSTESGICHTVTATCRPIIRSACSCIYRIWYLSHRYCYLPTHHQEHIQLYLQHCQSVTATCRYSGR